MKNYQGALLIILGGLILSFSLIYVVWTLFYGPVNSQGQPVSFTVSAGEGLEEIGQRLEEEGLIKNQKVFFVLSALGEIDSHLQEGEYQLSSADNLLEIILKLGSENSKPARILVIKEGETLREIQENLKDIFQQDHALEEIKTGEWKEEFLFLEDAPEEANLEGYLFPDTYFFSQSATTENIVRKILWNFEEKVKPLEAEMSEGGGIYQTMITASLLEEEVIAIEDKKVVAGIIEKRMGIGMPIQIDAALNYILQKKSRLSIADTKVDSPYNTYLNLGLPPGPISNPGLESIEAALNPETSPYLYYLTTSERKVIFSQTLKEHNEAKVKYYY